jgi:hypothetical protein
VFREIFLRESAVYAVVSVPCWREDHPNKAQPPLVHRSVAFLESM